MTERVDSMVDRYSVIREQREGVREESSPVVTPESELAFQARLYAGDLGSSWQGEDGEHVEIVHFGVWNREPGPDFIDAEVVIDGKACRGDIELDRENADWERHGHALNPTFSNVILHLFFKKCTRRFFTRTLENRQVVQAHLRMPEAARAEVVQNEERLEVEEADVLIAAAAKFRLLSKHQRWKRAEGLHGREDALFQSVATALGYKNNKIPFLLVAQRVRLARARQTEGEALLFGLAGFLQAERFEKCDEAGRAYLRALWDSWWKIQDREARLILPSQSWKFAPIRPANHPHRRMGALAVVTSRFSELSEAVKAGSQEKFITTLSGLRHEFWDTHWNVGGQALRRKVALIGGERINDMVLNVFLPTMEPEIGWSHLAQMKKPASSTKERRALEWLVGADEAARYPRSCLRQQGLLQLHDDFLPLSPRAVFESLKHAI